MPRFRYEALDQQGRPVRGAVAAPDVETAQQRAAGMGLRVLRVIGPPRGLKWYQSLARGYFSFICHRVNTKSLAVWYRSFGYLLGSGMGMMEATETMARRTRNYTLSRVSMEMAQEAEAGRPVAGVLANYPSAFPEFASAVLEAGQESGLLQQSLDRLADYYDQLYELQQAFRIETFYPKLLLLAFLVIPLIPELVLGGVERFLSGLWHRSWVFAAAIAGLWLGWRLLIQFRHFRQGFDRMKLSLPWFGPIARKTAVARWARAMAMLLNAGVPLSRSLEAAGGACGNAAIQHSVAHRIAAVFRGAPLSEIMAESRDFPDQAVDMVGTGERTGDTPEMLERMAGYYEMEATTSSKQTAVSVGVFAYLAVAILIGYFLISFWSGYYSELLRGADF